MLSRPPFPRIQMKSCLKEALRLNFRHPEDGRSRGSKLSVRSGGIEWRWVQVSRPRCEARKINRIRGELAFHPLLNEVSRDNLERCRMFLNHLLTGFANDPRRFRSVMTRRIPFSGANKDKLDLCSDSSCRGQNCYAVFSLPLIFV
jgi:hypothetical protein